MCLLRSLVRIKIDAEKQYKQNWCKNNFCLEKFFENIFSGLVRIYKLSFLLTRQFQRVSKQ
jgi:hypothetical protein